MKIRYGLMLAMAPLLMASTCDDSNSIQSRQQELILAQITNAVGMPAIVNFAEKRMMKEVFELRDQTLPTTTYVMDLYGKLHKVCDLIGYGLPYATEYTNPKYVASWSSHVILPQADPNGLFPPANAEGTWVACTNPATKKAQILYIEPRVVVSPFPLDVN